MSRLLCELEIDAAEWEFLARRIVQMGGTRPPQPIVQALDAPPDPDEDWDELTARAAKFCAEPGRETLVERVERILARGSVLPG